MQIRKGYKKGDRAIIYMPMSIEGVVSMQACARLGITHSVVFGGFSAKSLEERIVDVGAKLIITADEQIRGGKNIPLVQKAVDEALTGEASKNVKDVISIVELAKIEMSARDVFLEEIIESEEDTVNLFM